jgi:NADH-quinone oxidoreductase subunit C
MREATLVAMQSRFAALGVEATILRDALVLVVPPAAVSDTARRLKTEFACDLLADVTAVDWHAQAPRFEVVYHFYSTSSHVRVRLKTRLPEEEASVESLVPLFGSANFMERECHDMYGIIFRGHPDLRPILLYEGFHGHPLRKDYPKRREQPLVAYRTQVTD